ncbi:hypothetical protein EJ05DRAFT_195254 [Pseudovirgaria hyperparasitica]|uniref:Uncharacterized protein n=1 Tax=Pseudovirgaria hyperparasitica TaxID=470096 RepID=A0A6A6WIS5_9PEZI|nr:uncharacterized protein EJ05DRAFT_195254 [Pseudovirgaria hyperparasitica]KAF2762055.1 hypothetical protein EJ05DRAFT_195254 [Pseudovirgaria hyperparasitica]
MHTQSLSHIVRGKHGVTSSLQPPHSLERGPREHIFVPRHSAESGPLCPPNTHLDRIQIHDTPHSPSPPTNLPHNPRPFQTTSSRKHIRVAKKKNMPACHHEPDPPLISTNPIRYPYLRRILTHASTFCIAAIPISFSCFFLFTPPDRSQFTRKTTCL